MMNQESIKAIELDRKKTRILGKLISAFDGSLIDGEELIAEASSELANLRKEVFDYSEPTAADLVHDIYELATCELEESMTVDALQNKIFEKVDVLAVLLGVWKR